MTPAADQLVERAQLALRRLYDAPPVAQAAAAAIRAIGDAWPRRPLRIGIDGTHPSVRAAVLDAAFGGGVLPARVRGAAPLRVRRGDVTRFRIVHEGEPPEEHVFAPPRAPTAQPGDAAHRQLAIREHELAEVERGFPADVRVPPPRWAVWRWPLFWWRRWRAKAMLVARDRAMLALEAARRDVAAHEDEEPRAPDDATSGLAPFFAGLGAARAGVTEIEVELATGPLAAGIELVELAGTVRASADVDAVLIATPEGVLAPVRDGSTLRVGDADQVIRVLPVFLVHARALNLAREARDRIDAACAVLEGVLDRAEVEFATRLARLEMLRVTDAASLRADQLEQAKAEAISHVGTVMDHAASHLDAELAAVRQGWLAALEQPTSATELKTALAQIDAAWPETAQRIAKEVQLLVTGGLGGSIHDLVPALVAPLREQHGLTALGTPPASPLVIPMLPSLFSATTARWSGAGDWFTGLFRSFETRRAELADKVNQRADRISNVARAELLDAQPLMQAALGDALAAALDAAIARQAAWLDGEVARELAGIQRDRAALEPVQRIRVQAERDAHELAEQIDALEDELPGTAAASVAARLSVGSIPLPAPT